MSPSAPPSSGAHELSIRVVSLNCWGLKYLAAHRRERLAEIGRQLAALDPPPGIVGLQECWTAEDFAAIRAATRTTLPHGKFFFSGVLGGGLAILSRWPIEESQMVRYPLNGRPAAFWRGDWYVGKGVACARIRVEGAEGGGGGRGDPSGPVIEVFNTHLHAPYEPDLADSYLCHRVAQAWEMARLMRHAAARGSAVLGLGDFNLEPGALAHRLLVAHAPVRDVWTALHPDSALGRLASAAEKRRNPSGRAPTAREAVRRHGATCDSALNTWRWDKARQAALRRGTDVAVDDDQPDPNARRLDYIFASTAGWDVVDVAVGMTARHPRLKCSLSDHFSVDATLRLTLPNAGGESNAAGASTATAPLDVEAYDEILAMVAAYTQREERQRTWRLAHFGTEVFVALGCWTAVWWAPHPGVAFALMVVSTLGFAAGVVDGLMGFLFVGSEVRALREFEYEIRTARSRAAAHSNPPRSFGDRMKRKPNGLRYLCACDRIHI